MSFNSLSEGVKMQNNIRNIPENWDIVKVKDVARINELSVSNNYQHDKIEYIDIKSVEKRQILNVQQLLLSEAPSRARRIVRVNDILISTVRPNLKHFSFVKKAKPNTIASTGFAVITAHQTNPQYLYYYLTTDKFTNYLSQIAETHTSTYPSFNPDVIENSDLFLPPAEEQCAIASILSSHDDKIELNRQMNTTLEAISQAIFKHWFVEFEFPNEEGKPYKSSGGEMEETELGEVPIGWRVEEIGNIVKVVGGGTPSTKNPAFWEAGSHCWTTPKDLSGISSPVILDTAKKITDAGLAKISSGLLPKGTFLLSSRAPVGYTAIAQVPIAVNQGYIAIPPSEQLSTLFLLYWTRENLETIEGRACGTTFQEISKKNFKPISLAMPLPEILVEFDKTVGYLFERIVVNERESRTLANIRDALLPKLMSGEIRVK